MAARNGTRDGTRVSICVTHKVAPALNSGTACSTLAANETDAQSLFDVREPDFLSKLACKKFSGVGPGMDSAWMNVCPSKSPLYLSRKPLTKSAFFAQYS